MNNEAQNPLEQLLAAGTVKNDKVYQKEYRAKLLAHAKAEGIGIVHINPNYLNKGGLTIAFKKCNDFKSGVMVDVAVAVCSDKDTFSRKIGAQIALEKFWRSETIQLPLLRLYTENDLSYSVKVAFSALYDCM